MQQQAYTKIQYRNAVYQGFVLQQKRNGFGVLITDDAHVFIANWIHNKIDGMYLFISQNIKAYGQMANGKLVNFNVVETAQTTIYGNFKNNILNGEAVIKNSNGIQKVKFIKGRHCESQTLKKSDLRQTLIKLFPDDVFTIREFLELFVQDRNLIMNTYFRQIILSEMYRYYGFINKVKQGEGLGCVLRKDGFLYSCGVYDKTELNGLGRMYPNMNQYYDGVFKHNVMKGIGVKYNKQNNEFSIGIHQQNKNSDIMVHSGEPVAQLREIRKQFHLRSIHFVNQIIISDMIIELELHRDTQLSEVSSDQNTIPPKINMIPFQINQDHKSSFRDDIVDESIPSEYGSSRRTPVDNNSRINTPTAETQSRKLYNQRFMKEQVFLRQQQQTPQLLNTKKSAKHLHQIQTILNGMRKTNKIQQAGRSPEQKQISSKKRQIGFYDDNIESNSPQKNMKSYDFEPHSKEIYFEYSNTIQNTNKKNSQYVNKFMKDEESQKNPKSYKLTNKPRSKPTSPPKAALPPSGHKLDLHQIYKQTGLYKKKAVK